MWASLTTDIAVVSQHLVKLKFICLKLRQMALFERACEITLTATISVYTSLCSDNLFLKPSITIQVKKLRCLCVESKKSNQIPARIYVFDFLACPYKSSFEFGVRTLLLSNRITRWRNGSFEQEGRPLRKTGSR